MKEIIFFMTFLVVFASVSGTAAEGKKWSDEAELSFVDTGGNTNVTTLSAKNVLRHEFTEKLLGTWKLGGLYSKSNGVRKAESYYTELRQDYLYTERIYSFVSGGWLRDNFAGLHNRYYGGLGGGYKFLKGPHHFLSSELGLDYVREKYTDHTNKDYFRGRAFAQYAFAFTKRNKFSQSLEFLYDFDDPDNYNLNSETALVSALNSYLSLKASYVVKYDHEPVPAELRKTDTILSIGLLVNF